MMWLGRFMLVGAACALPSFAWAQAEVVPSPSNESPRLAAAPRQVYHSGWGFLSADGALSGKVVCVGAAGELVPQQNATVTLSRGTVPLSSGQTQADGSFAFSGLSEGVYEISAESPGCYATHSFQAVRDTSGQAAPAMHVYASSMQRSSVDETIHSLWAPHASQLVARPFEEVMAPWIPATQSPRVSIINGLVSGQVAFENASSIPEAHVVKVFRNGKLLATAPVDNLGTFSFPVQSPGPVDIVLGGSAYASLGVHLVDASQLANRAQSGAGFVSTLVQGTPSAPTLLIPAAGGGSNSGTVLPPPGLPGMQYPLSGGFVPGGGFGGGGFGGGSGGGSGGGGFGGGGLGGIGGLLGVAGLAVGVAALAEDDEGFNVNAATPLNN